MKKRIGYKLEDNDLDNVSGGRLPSGFGDNYAGWVKCLGCGLPLCKMSDVKDGIECPDCGSILRVREQSAEL